VCDCLRVGDRGGLPETKEARLGSARLGTRLGLAWLGSSRRVASRRERVASRGVAWLD